MSRSVVHIVGARPQFVKAAVVVRETRDTVPTRLIHTGQHYDPSLSDVFFHELDLPKPDYHLGVGSCSHGAQTAAMLIGIEDILSQLERGIAVVYGDTNSTLAGALAAVKLGWPVVHVEAGLRSFDRSMPEEINRISVDHMSHSLLCPTQTAMEHLANEGLANRAKLVGDVMLDAALHAQERCTRESRIGRLLSGQTPIDETLDERLVSLAEAGTPFILATIHRAANTDDGARLKTLITSLSGLPLPVVMPLHPRTRQAMMRHGIEPKNHLFCIPPVGYLDFTALISGSSHVITDSGGVQKEAFFHGRLCTTLRDTTEWPETLIGDWNRLVDVDVSELKAAVSRHVVTPAELHSAFGGGQAGKKTGQVLETMWSERMV